MTPSLRIYFFLEKCVINETCQKFASHSRESAPPNLVQAAKWRKTQSISESRTALSSDGCRPEDSGGRAMEKAHLPFGRWGRAKGGEGREVRTCEEGCGSGTVTEREMGTLAPLKQPPTGWPISRHGPGPGHNAIFLGERVPIHFALCSTLSSCPHLQLARWPTALFGRLVGEFLPLPFQ